MTSPIIESICNMTSLHWVLEWSDWTLDEIKEHLERGFYYVEEQDDQGRTPLLALVEKPNCSAIIVEVLLQNGAKVDKQDSYGRTPLFVALENEECSADVIRVLLYYGADPNCRCSMGISPLITALRHTREEAIIRLLLQKGAILQLTNHIDPSPLCVALCSDASKDVVKLLLDFGCILDGCRQHTSAMHCALSFPNPGLREDILEVLLDAGARVDCADLDGQQLVCFAIQKGANVGTIKMLQRAGVLLDACTLHTTPLLCVTSPYSDFLVMTRLERLDRKKKAGCLRMPLQSDVVQFLLEEENSKWGEEGLKPVLCALRYCDYDTKAIRLLLNRASRRTMSSIRHAFCRRLLSKMVFDYDVTPSVVKLLIERRFLKVSSMDRFRDTLLHRALAAQRCEPEMVKILLEKGCSVYAENSSCWTPLEMAVRFRKNADILHLLLAAGSRVGARARKQPPLLDRAIIEYNCQKTTNKQRSLEYRESLKTLFKFAFLEYPEFDIGYLISKGLVSNALLGFVKSCMTEVQNMQKEVLGDSCDTLFDIIAQKRRRVEVHELDQLLRVLVNSSFPIYRNLVLSKISRKLLLIKLQDLPIYTVRTCDISLLLEQEVFLCYECVCGIAQFLSFQDFFNFVLAFVYLNKRHRNINSLI